MYLHPLEVTGWPVMGFMEKAASGLRHLSHEEGGKPRYIMNHVVSSSRKQWMIGMTFEDPFQKVKLSVCLMECASDQSLSGSSQEDGNTVCTGRWLMSTMFELGWWASLNLLVQISLQYCHVPLAYGGCFGETPSTSISFSLLLGNSFKTAIVVEEMAGLKNQRRNQETS